MHKLIKEPLFHFLVLGLLLFFVVRFFAPGVLQLDSITEISVNADSLTKYLQFQRKSFRADQAEAMLSIMSEADQKLLIDNYIRDEALYREAILLGLDDNDEIIRRRLIQKMEYIAQGFYNELPTIDQSILQVYFDDNRQKYRIDPSITFTHVFISSSVGSDAQGSDRGDNKASAWKTLAELNQLAVPFEDAARYGDRFLYNLNYVERTPAYIANHFGKSFSESVFELPPGNSWQGPVKSEYGFHVVLIKDKTDSRLPLLTEVAEIVLADVQREQQRLAKLVAVKTIVDKYSVLNTLNESPNAR